MAPPQIEEENKDEHEGENEVNDHVAEMQEESHPDEFNDEEIDRLMTSAHDEEVDIVLFNQIKSERQPVG